MGWTMFFMFVALKVPLLTLCWLVWWAIHQTDDPAQAPDDGGTRRPNPHPPQPQPNPRRRGPHGDPAPPPPPRVRVATVRARELTQRTSPSRLCRPAQASAGTGER